MIKMIVLLKRKAGLTRDQFIARYEGGHAKLAEKHLTNAVRYVRRYLEPLPELFTGDTIEPEHDVITEVWFENQEQYEIAMKRLRSPKWLRKSSRTRKRSSSATNTACSWSTSVIRRAARQRSPRQFLNDRVPT